MGNSTCFVPVVERTALGQVLQAALPLQAGWHGRVEQLDEVVVRWSVRTANQRPIPAKLKAPELRAIREHLADSEYGDMRAALKRQFLEPSRVEAKLLKHEIRDSRALVKHERNELARAKTREPLQAALLQPELVFEVDMCHRLVCDERKQLCFRQERRDDLANIRVGLQLSERHCAPIAPPDAARTHSLLAALRERVGAPRWFVLPPVGAKRMPLLVHPQ
mmetsp:Transcript_23063/g.73834  ORF Transcript_23063/g.73834 Transcript_23063/m.73834 type:complete len:221 (+) Transcript_23063:1469-2131(+)